MVSFVSPLTSASASSHSASARTSLSVSWARCREFFHARPTISPKDQNTMNGHSGSQSSAKAAPSVPVATSP